GVPRPPPAREHRQRFLPRRRRRRREHRRAPGGTMTTFRNEPLLELRREAVRRQALEALATLDAQLPLEVPMLIGDSVVTGRKFASVDPSQPTRIVAHAPEATEQHVKDAIAGAETGHKAWSRKPAADRAA